MITVSESSDYKSFNSVLSGLWDGMKSDQNIEMINLVQTHGLTMLEATEQDRRGFFLVFNGEGHAFFPKSLRGKWAKRACEAVFSYLHDVMGMNSIKSACYDHYIGAKLFFRWLGFSKVNEINDGTTFGGIPSKRLIYEKSLT